MIDSEVKFILDSEYRDDPLYPFLVKYFENGGMNTNDTNKQALQNLS